MDDDIVLTGKKGTTTILDDPDDYVDWRPALMAYLGTKKLSKYLRMTARPATNVDAYDDLVSVRIRRQKPK